MKVKIVDMDHRGNGIAKENNKVIFVPKSITGDVLDIDIVKNHKKYDDGRKKIIVESSADRIESLCPYYDICGGCNISNLNYSRQLEYKKNKVINIFKKYLKMDINPEIIGSDNRYEYRNKITYHCIDKKIGLVSIDNELIEIDKCYLVSDGVNELYQIIRNEDLSLIKKIVIKECDNGLLLSIDGKMNINNLIDKGLAIYINGECVSKKSDGYIFVRDIKYLISINSFFQINTSNISRLYDVVLKYGEFSEKDHVIDLYCGVGSISLYISKYVDSVLGIEIIEDAIKDAKENAKINNINNVEFICGDVSKLIDDNIFGDVVIVDPPRIGLDNHTIDILNKIDIDRLVYVSCDVMTLVRDLSKLNSYLVKEVTLVDMFPQTHNVECVVKLNRIKKAFR